MLHPDVARTLSQILPDGDPLSPEHQDAINSGADLRSQFDESLGPGWRPKAPVGFYQGDPNWAMNNDPGFFVETESDAVPMPQVGDPNWGAKYDPGFGVAGSYGQPSGMPDYIYESIQRQYGNKKYGDYKLEDMKNVINWHKKA